MLVSIPGAFAPSCQAVHLPLYISEEAVLKSLGDDIVAIIASNDAWVVCAWGKFNGGEG